MWEKSKIKNKEKESKERENLNSQPISRYGNGRLWIELQRMKSVVNDSALAFL